MFAAFCLAAGAAAMYFFDPEQGMHRRNRMMGKVDQFKADHPELVQTAEAKTVVLRERAQGLLDQTKAKIEEKIDPKAPDAKAMDSMDSDPKVTDIQAKRAA